MSDPATTKLRRFDCSFTRRVLLGISFIVALAPSAIAQQVLLGSGQSAADKKSDHAGRSLAAIDLAILAAENGAMDVSLEAMRRACRQGPPVASIQLGGILGTPQPSQSFNAYLSGSSEPHDTAEQRFSERLQDLQEVWKQVEIDPNDAYEVWKGVVFPPDRPNEGFAYSTIDASSSSISYNNIDIDAKKPELAKSGAQTLVEWAREAEQLDDLNTLLGARRKMPGAADTVLLIDMLLVDRATISEEEAESLCDRITSKVTSVVHSPNAELLLGCAWEVVEKQSDDSPAARRLTEAILHEIRGKPRWGANAWFRYIVATNLKQSIQSGDVERFEQALELAMTYFDEIRQGNESFVASREAIAYSIAAQRAFDQGNAKLGATCLQRFMMSPTASRYGEINLQQIVNPSHPTMQSLMSLPREDRYGALSELVWNLPALGMHDCTHTRPTFDPPELFRRENNPHPSRQVVGDDALLITLLEWVMRDAIALGKQSDVEKHIAELDQSGSDDAKIARLAYQFAQGEPVDVAPFASVNDEGDIELHPVYPNRGRVHWLDLVVARHAMQDKKYAAAAGQFINERWDNAFNVNFNYEMAWLTSFRLEKRMSEGELLTHADLQHWGLGCDIEQPALAHGRPPKTVWRQREGDSWGYEVGPDVSYLFLKYPLGGDYTIRFRLKDGRSAEGGAMVGGRLLEFMPRDRQVWLWGIANRGRSNISTSAIKRDAWNDYRIECTNGQLKLVIGDNDFESSLGQVSDACPFFALMAYHFRPSTYDSITIKGDYTIPRSVDLLSPMMQGWSTRWFRENMPAITAEANEDQPAFDKNVTDPLSWRVVDGVMESVPSESLKEDDSPNAESERHQAYAYYLRPLCDGEQVSFEFYYEPGKYTVAPCIGRVAMLLTEPEMPLHWVACGIPSWTGVEETNQVVDPNAEQLAAAELRENDWNQLVLRLEGDIVMANLNGKDVYRRSFDPSVGRQFGLFHDPASYQVRIRKVKLSGNWPEKLPKDFFEQAKSDNL